MSEFTPRNDFLRQLISYGVKSEHLKTCAWKIATQFCSTIPLLIATFKAQMISASFSKKKCIKGFYFTAQNSVQQLEQNNLEHLVNFV